MLLVCLAWIVKPVFAYDVPDYQNWVTDLANIYSPEFEEKLNTKLALFESETGAEVAVLTISKLPEASIEEYAVSVVEKWGVGKKGEDNGALIIIAKDDREIRIEVGYGLEGTITDGMAGRIIRDEMTPQFKLENYEEGTEMGVEKIMGYIKGEIEPVSEAVSREESDQQFSVFVLGIIFLMYVASYLGRSKEFLTGGIVGVVIGLMFAGVGMAIVLGVIGLILDLILSRNYKKSVRMGYPTSFSRSLGGFRSSGGSSGGFGGFGGGRSGGGGASGKW